MSYARRESVRSFSSIKIKKRSAIRGVYFCIAIFIFSCTIKNIMDVQSPYDSLLVVFDSITILLGIVGLLAASFAWKTGIGGRLTSFFRWFRVSLLFYILSFGLSVFSTLYAPDHDLLELIHHILLVLGMTAAAYAMYTLYKLLR